MCGGRSANTDCWKQAIALRTPRAFWVRWGFFSNHQRLRHIAVHQGLLRREEDERTVQRRAGKPERSNVSLGTEGFNRTGTCESSSSARRDRFSTKRPDTFTRTALRQLQTSCSSAADHTLSVNEILRQPYRKTDPQFRFQLKRAALSSGPRVEQKVTWLRPQSSQ